MHFVLPYVLDNFTEPAIEITTRVTDAPTTEVTTIITNGPTTDITTIIPKQMNADTTSALATIQATDYNTAREYVTTLTTAFTTRETVETTKTATVKVNLRYAWTKCKTIL